MESQSRITGLHIAFIKQKGVRNGVANLKWKIYKRDEGFKYDSNMWLFEALCTCNQMIPDIVYQSKLFSEQLAHSDRRIQDSIRYYNNHHPER